jgi:hypothetical protein
MVSLRVCPIVYESLWYRIYSYNLLSLLYSCIMHSYIFSPLTHGIYMHTYLCIGFHYIGDEPKVLKVGDYAYKVSHAIPKYNKNEMRTTWFVLSGPQKNKSIIAATRQALCLYCHKHLRGTDLHYLDQHMRKQDHSHLLCWELIPFNRREEVTREWKVARNSIDDRKVKTEDFVIPAGDKGSKKRATNPFGFPVIGEPATKKPKVSDFPEIWAKVIVAGKSELVTYLILCTC